MILEPLLSKKGLVIQVGRVKEMHVLLKTLVHVHSPMELLILAQTCFVVVGNIQLPAVLERRDIMSAVQIYLMVLGAHPEIPTSFLEVEGVVAVPARLPHNAQMGSIIAGELHACTATRFVLRIHLVTLMQMEVYARVKLRQLQLQTST